MRITYGKLIRDRIPEIMDTAGVEYEVVELDDAGYRSALLAKVREEADEITAAASTADRTREIADLYEVLDALLVCEGVSASTLAYVRRRRREERGGFERRLELRWTRATCTRKVAVPRHPLRTGPATRPPTRSQRRVPAPH